MTELHGILSASATPMARGGESIDEPAYVALLEAQVQGGVHGVIVGGSTGEHSTLTIAERKRLCELAVKAVKGKTTIIAHVGSTTTRDSVDLTRHAMATGADRIMALVPYYDRISWDEAKQFLSEVAEAAGGPSIYYDSPRVNGQDLTEEQLCELVALKLISHVKDSPQNFVRTRRLLSNPDAPIVLAGSDPALMSVLNEGAPGTIIGASAMVPELCVDLYHAIKTKGELNEIKAAWARLWPILNFLLRNGYIGLVKAGIELRGLRAGPPRKPLLPPKEGAVAQLKALLDEAGVGPFAEAAPMSRVA